MPDVLFVQLVAQSGASPREIDVVWLVGAVGAALTGAIGVLWRQSVAESKRKDELIDRLLASLDRVTEVQDRGLNLVEKDRSMRR